MCIGAFRPFVVLANRPARFEGHAAMSCNFVYTSILCFKERLFSLALLCVCFQILYSPLLLVEASSRIYHPTAPILAPNVDLTFKLIRRKARQRKQCRHLPNRCGLLNGSLIDRTTNRNRVSSVIFQRIQSDEPRILSKPPRPAIAAIHPWTVSRPYSATTCRYCSGY